MAHVEMRGAIAMIVDIHPRPLRSSAEEHRRQRAQQREAMSSDDLAGVQLLRDAITASGLSVRAYAQQVLTRDPRTVWRWIAGAPMPRAVRERLQAEAAGAPRRSNTEED